MLLHTKRFKIKTLIGTGIYSNDGQEFQSADTPCDKSFYIRFDYSQYHVDVSCCLKGNQVMT